MRTFNGILPSLVLSSLIFSGSVARAQVPAASGTVLTIAGTGGGGIGGFSGDGGPAANATLADPSGLAIGPDGTLYFSDTSNFRIRAIAPATGIITTVAGNGNPGNAGDDGPAINATFDPIFSLAVDRARHALYLPDFDNSRVRKVNLTNGLISNYAGGTYGFSGDNGPATIAQLASPYGVATDGVGKLLIADRDNNRIRRVDPVTGFITTIAGNPGCLSSGDGGSASTAVFASLLCVGADRAGNVFALESGGNCGGGHPDQTPRVRRIDAVTGIITTVAGGGTNLPGTGPATNMNLGGVWDLAVSDSGTLFIANQTRVLKVDLATGQLSPYAGDGTADFSGDGGPALSARFNLLSGGGLTLAPGGGLVISDGANQRIRYVVPDSITLNNDSQQTTFYLPWVSALSGDLIIMDNPNLTKVSARSLAHVGGSVNVSDNTSTTVIDLSSLGSVNGALNVSGNTATTVVDLSSLTTTAGSMDVVGNTSANVVDVHSLTTTGGSVDVSDNTSTTVIDLSSLGSVNGALNVSGNTATTVVDLSSLTTTAGSMDVVGNTSANVVDVHSLTTTGGSVDVSDNTSTTVIKLGSLGSVNGALNVSGNTSTTVIDLGSLTTVAGNIAITANAPNVTVDLSSLCSFGCDANLVVMTLSDGTFIVNNCLTFCANATLTGNATLAGSVTINGTISPGSSPGRLNFTRNLVLGNASRLKMELGGSAPGQFDFINVNSNGTLGGTLAVSLIANFPGVMTNGAGFTLLTAGSPLTGAFANVASGGTLTTTDGYARFTVLYAGGNSVRLTNLVIVDTDSDGLPDWWEDRFALSKTSAADAALDADGDGASNLNEFLAGTNPTNAASVFHVVSLQRETDSVRLTWSTVGGKSYVVQTNGVLSGAFTDLSPLITVPGAGESVTNFVDSGAATNASVRYYRVRLGQ